MHVPPISTFALDDDPTMTTKIRVLVVDDSALVRSLLAEIINRQGDMACVGAAADPLIAREMIRELNPDVITLDVEMPHMDGIEFLSRLMRLRPMPVVMVSTLTQHGAELTLRALELGAIDFVAKPQIGVGDGLALLADEISAKIRIAARAQLQRARRTRAATARARGAGPREHREGHLHRRVHRRHRGHQAVAAAAACRCAGAADHAAHAAAASRAAMPAGWTACAASR